MTKPKGIEEVAASTLKGFLAAAALLGVPEYVAQKEAIEATKEKTGVDFSRLLMFAPTQETEEDPLKVFLEGYKFDVLKNKKNFVSNENFYLKYWCFMAEKGVKEADILIKYNFFKTLKLANIRFKHNSVRVKIDGRQIRGYYLIKTVKD